MKQSLHKIILSIACFAVFFTGMGVTILDYCCTNCITNILSDESNSCCSSTSDVNHSCCDSHNNELDSQDFSDCATHNHMTRDKVCSASRLSIDLSASIFKPEVFAPVVWLSHWCDSLPNSFINTSINHNNVFSDIDPPEISPRTYLSLIRILII